MTFEPTIRTLLVTCVESVLQTQEAVESNKQRSRRFPMNNVSRFIPSVEQIADRIGFRIVVGPCGWAGGIGTGAYAVKYKDKRRHHWDY